MGKTPTSVIKTEVVSPDLEKLEALVSDFTAKADKILEEDHRKTGLVYDFLFLGQPTADPPVPPFVAQVQASISSHEKQLDGIKTAATRLLWTVIGILLTGAAWFIGTTLTHIFSK